MGLGNVQVILLVAILGLQSIMALFDGLYHPPPLAATAHFYSKPAPINLPSRALDDKFYFSLSTKPKKPKYLVAKLTDGWKGIDVQKKQPIFQEPLRPLPFHHTFNALPKVQDDVKPVTEHIEGDLMYDFRTNTHSV